MHQGFSDEPSRDHCAPNVRGKSAALKMPAQDIGPTWGDWADATFCGEFDTKS